jgi:DNA-binding NarL/FixJ family response regulator
LEICSARRDNDDTDNLLPPIPDAIVSDVRMPGKDGLELLRLIRADERLARVPVVLLTAKGMTADRIAGYKAGANAYLPKPFDPAELLSILDNSIERRKQMANNQKGGLLDLKQEMANIKDIMRRNGEKVVQKTSVYLTLVEREVLELLCRGYTNKEIAEERGVSITTVNRTIQKLYRVTDTDTRTELVRWAFKTGYVSKQ